MQKTISLFALSLLALFIIGCAPSVTVENKTGFAVRAVVHYSGGRDVLSPSPGETSTTDVTEGVYTVAVIQDQDWLNYAKTKRTYLNDRLAHADELTGPQLLDVVNQLKDIARQMQQYEASAKSGGAACTGRVTSESDGVVEISTEASGKLVVTCK